MNRDAWNKLLEAGQCNTFEDIVPYGDKKVKIELYIGYSRSPNWCEYVSAEISGVDYSSRYTFYEEFYSEDINVHFMERDNDYPKSWENIYLEICKIYDFISGKEVDFDYKDELIDCITEATPEFLEWKNKKFEDEHNKCFSCEGYYTKDNNEIYDSTWICYRCKNPGKMLFAEHLLVPGLSSILCNSMPTDWSKQYE